MVFQSVQRDGQRQNQPARCHPNGALSTQEKWTTGNTILKSNSTQFSTTVTVGPKNAVKPGGVAALLLMAFNGSVTLPYTAFGKLIQGGDSMDVG